MSRCMFCDYCDTAGSISTPVEGSPSIRWNDKISGFVCDECSDDRGFDGYVDLDFNQMEKEDE